MQEGFDFHRGEREAQRRFATQARWDGTRRRQLLWREIPPSLHARLESAPFFFLCCRSLVRKLPHVNQVGSRGWAAAVSCFALVVLWVFVPGNKTYAF